ncbi:MULTISPECIES: hypothetical protein [Pandoraea]|uniref:hypothetical protein n=1 Tax=Pandoraea TaxID=93217 RepID=UPI0003D1E424|nr:MULTISPECIES: hypothetical protein [Pandoraea]AHB78233.1 hypothetical protein X636_24460 [Pandoraea pnomenusa]
MASSKHNPHEQGIRELLYQAYETELGGEKVYSAALGCVKNADLKKEWTEYLEQTRQHQQVLLNVISALGLDPDAQSPGRDIVAHHGASLVKAIALASNAGNPTLAQIVAAECVVLAETKDHQNWELLAMIAGKSEGDLKAVLSDAVAAVEHQEDHHLYHTMGWARELWIDTLGYPAVLPPPEERKHVESAIGASRAEQARETLLSSRH